MSEGGRRVDAKKSPSTNFDPRRVTVVTVVYNSVGSIERTIRSVLDQDYGGLEYIVIDAASSDGTLEVIRSFEDKIDHWLSEADAGVYFGMNKGIDLATGEWVGFMNSGDVFPDNSVLSSIFEKAIDSEIDVIFGSSSCRESDGSTVFQEAGSDLSLLALGPIFRHGASFVRTSLHKQYRFDTLLAAKLGFALDFHLIHRLYTEGRSFLKLDREILVYERAGLSNRPYQSQWYTLLITTNFRPSIGAKWKLGAKFIYQFLRNNKALRYLSRPLYFFFTGYLLNEVIAKTPFWIVRRAYLRLVGMRVGRGSVINMGPYFLSPKNITIGESSHINRECLLDGRGKLVIGNSVSISYRVNLVTGSHDVHSSAFAGKYRPITIGDYAWIGVNATILQGVRIGRGAVVAAGAVVTKDVPEFSIVGGVPARQIGTRNRDLDYKCRWGSPFA